MAISKVIYGGKTLIDLTSDTVESNKLLQGITAHGKDGEEITGTCAYDSDTSDGTATASEILYGKTAYVNSNKLTGTMTNNGANEINISEASQKITIPQGFHDGSGFAQISLTEQAKLISENIKQGIVLLGVTGSHSGTESVNAESKEVTPTTSDQTIIPDSEAGYNYLSQVIVKAIPYVEAENSAGGITVTIG